MSPLALVGLPRKEGEEEIEDEERQAQLDEESEDSEEEQSEDSDGAATGINDAQELEEMKSLASSSLRRIYFCHACDDVYNEGGSETFGRSLVVFRNFPEEKWKSDSLELGGSSYHRALAWEEGNVRSGKGIKKEDRDIFDDSGLGFPDDKSDGWPPF